MSQKKEPVATDLFRKMWPFARPYAGRIAGCLLLMLLSTAIQLSLPLGVKELLDHMLNSGEAGGLTHIALFLVAIFLVRSVITFFSGYVLQLTGDSITNELRVKLFQHYQLLPLKYHHNHRIGDFMSRVYGDAPEIRNVITNLTVSGMTNFFQLAGASAVMLYMNWQLGLIVLMLCPATTLLGRLYAPRFKGLSLQIKSSLTSAMGHAQESIAGTHVVRIFAPDGTDVEKFKRMMNDHLHLAGQGRRADASYTALIALLTVLATIFMFWFGGNQVSAGRLSVGALVAFFLFSQSVSQSIGFLAQLYSAIHQSAGASAKVFELLEVPIEQDKAEQGRKFTGDQAVIEFRQVSFQYHAEVPVLKNISFRVDPGKMVAIVGHSGIGKSSLLSLLPRFYDATAGQILLNGIDIREYSLASLRGAISMVSQDVFLFSASVRDNIRYGLPEASEADVEQAAIAANAHRFILNLKDGYDTQVGERGVQLSGGQRQRIAIARALLRQAPILILDEATSAIDAETDGLIREALKRLTANRTTLVVAHRPSTIADAHNVVNLAYLEEQAAVQQGLEATV